MVSICNNHIHGKHVYNCNTDLYIDSCIHKNPTRLICLGKNYIPIEGSTVVIKSGTQKCHKIFTKYYKKDDRIDAFGQLNCSIILLSRDAESSESI